MAAIERLDQLRRRFRSRFDTNSDLTDYVGARDLQGLTPDPAWLEDHELPPEELLRERVDAWLAAQGESVDPRQLEPIDDVRSGNAAMLERDLPGAADVVFAWSTAQGTEPAESWSELQRVRDRLSDAGALDFLVLDEPTLLAWLQALGLWPDQMPLSLDLLVLGISEALLAAARDRKAAAAHKQRRRRTELTFGGETYDTATSELLDFLKAVDASVNDDFLGTPARLTLLAPQEPSVTGGQRPGNRPKRGGPGGRPRGPKPTEEQTNAIGRAGEILAYRWLQRAYRETTPDSWVSRNRRFVLGGDAGDDSLGFDFRVAGKRETLLFEVKTTITDEDVFEISDNELRAARDTRKSWYRIIFIRSLLEPELRELLILPNPLDPAYRQVRRGLRLGFERGLAGELAGPVDVVEHPTQ